MDKRRFTRISFDAPVDIRQGQHHWQSRLLDLSLQGLLFARPIQFEPDLTQDIVVTFSLDGLTQPIQMEGKITRNESLCVGIRAELVDLDSISQLRRLVELNMGDDALLHRNLDNLIAHDE